MTLVVMRFISRPALQAWSFHEPRLGPYRGAVQPNNVLLVLEDQVYRGSVGTDLTTTVRMPRTLEEVPPCLRTIAAAAAS